METLEFKILSKRQALKDQLRFALKESPTVLRMVKELKLEISICDIALQQLSFKRAQTKLG